MNARVARIPRRRLRVHPDPATVAYIGIGVRAAIDRAGRAFDPDRFGGEIGLVTQVVEPHALELDRMDDRHVAEGGDLEGVFAYEVAEQFGHDYAMALIHRTGEEPTVIATRLFNQLAGIDGDAPSS